MGAHEDFKGRWGRLVTRDQSRQAHPDLFQGGDKGSDLAASEKFNLVHRGPVQRVNHADGQDV